MPIRILVVCLPPIQSEIVRSLLEAEEDLEVVSCLDDDSRLSEVIRETGADVVIRASPENDLRAAAGSLLEDHPHLKFVAITPNGRDAFRVELRPHVARIREVSSQGLVEAIRGVASAEVPWSE